MVKQNSAGLNRIDLWQPICHDDAHQRQLASTVGVRKCSRSRCSFEPKTRSASSATASVFITQRLASWRVITKRESIEHWTLNLEHCYLKTFKIEHWSWRMNIQHWTYNAKSWPCLTVKCEIMTVAARLNIQHWTYCEIMTVMWNHDPDVKSWPWRYGTWDLFFQIGAQCFWKRLNFWRDSWNFLFYQIRKTNMKIIMKHET